MAKRKFLVEVTHHVDVTLDDSMFTDECVEEFRDYSYSFADIKDHVEHLAFSKVQDLIYIEDDKECVEGYPPLDTFDCHLDWYDISFDVSEELSK